MKRINLRKELEGQKKAIKFQNSKECQEFLELCDSQDIVWVDEDKASDFNFMNMTTRNSVDIYEGKLSISTTTWYQMLGFELIDYKEFIKEKSEKVTIKDIIKENGYPYVTFDTEYEQTEFLELCEKEDIKWRGGEKSTKFRARIEFDFIRLDYKNELARGNKKVVECVKWSDIRPQRKETLQESYYSLHDIILFYKYDKRIKTYFVCKETNTIINFENNSIIFRDLETKMIKNIDHLNIKYLYKKHELENCYTFVEIAKMKLKEYESIKVVLNGNIYISRDLNRLMEQMQIKEPSKSILKAMNKPMWKIISDYNNKLERYGETVKINSIGDITID